MTLSIHSTGYASKQWGICRFEAPYRTRLFTGL